MKQIHYLYEAYTLTCYLYEVNTLTCYLYEANTLTSKYTIYMKQIH